MGSFCVIQKMSFKDRNLSSINAVSAISKQPGHSPHGHIVLYELSTVLCSPYMS